VKGSGFLFLFLLLLANVRGVKEGEKLPPLIGHLCLASRVRGCRIKRPSIVCIGKRASETETMSRCREASQSTDDCRINETKWENMQGTMAVKYDARMRTQVKKKRGSQTGDTRQVETGGDRWRGRGAQGGAWARWSKRGCKWERGNKNQANGRAKPGGEILRGGASRATPKSGAVKGGNGTGAGGSEAACGWRPDGAKVEADQWEVEH
jgi:hypothetical protein